MILKEEKTAIFLKQLALLFVLTNLSWTFLNFCCICDEIPLPKTYLHCGNFIFACQWLVLLLVLSQGILQLNGRQWVCSQNWRSQFGKPARKGSYGWNGVVRVFSALVLYCVRVTTIKRRHFKATPFSFYTSAPQLPS